MSDTVLALVPRTNLSAVLTAFHRGGYGHVIRVVDPKRAPLASQLQRAGVMEARLATATSRDDVVVFIPAPQRTTQAAALALNYGATDIELATRGAATSETIAPRLINRAASRRDRTSSRRAVTLPPAPGARADVTAD